MKTVRDACQLQDNALSVKLSDQIEQLDELIADEEDGEAFFARTHITEGMQRLISEGIARLAGRSSQAVFHLKQAMGGGKTHLMISFGLLAKHPRLRAKYAAGVSGAGDFGSAAIAAFNGRNTPAPSFGARSPNSSARASNSAPSGRLARARRTSGTGSRSSMAMPQCSSCSTRCRPTSTTWAPRK